jgi:hypothetical protein
MKVSGNGGSVAVGFGPAVTDGGTTFVGAPNDYSGTCTGDGGTIKVEKTQFAILCAHFVLHSGQFNTGNPKMRFAFLNSPGQYAVVRITDNGNPGTNDSFAFGFTPSLLDAIAWVNTGVIGAGHPFTLWDFHPVGNGNYTVQP